MNFYNKTLYTASKQLNQSLYTSHIIFYIVYNEQSCDHILIQAKFIVLARNISNFSKNLCQTKL
jgi:hypothetical protein